MKNVKVIFLFFIMIYVREAYPDEQCYEYTEGSSIVVGIDVSEKVDSKLKISFSDFIGAARKNDVNNISKQFSTYDESKDSLLKSLKKIPDKFALYSGIKSFTFGSKMYRWGDYSFVYVNYEHTNGQLAKAESFFCTNDCLMSDIFEHSERDEGIDIISRLLYLVNKDDVKKINCPNSSSLNPIKFSLFPKFKTKDKFPLNVYMRGISKSNIKIYDHDNLEVVVKSENQACSERLLQGGKVFLLNGEVNSDLVNDVLKNCTINTKMGSLIPVVFISKDKIEKRYLSVESYISRITSINKYESIMQVSDKKGRWALIARVTFSTNEQAILVIPYLKNKEIGLFDWGGFGEAVGELLTNRSLSKLLNMYITGSK